MSKGMLIIISGPSGSGKGTVVKELCKDEQISLSISLTTRTPRPGEVDGASYRFVSTDYFLDKLKENEFLESASFAGNYYGTPKDFVEKEIEENRSVVLEIDVNGALQVRDNYPNSVLIFLTPPTYCELRRRLVERNTETMDTIEERMARAKEEVKLIDKYDYFVVNDDLALAVDELKTIIKAEKSKVSRKFEIINRVLEDF